ncbi:putative phage abortive infection protein [Azonexus hydrophilus]|uniref:Phage abortive infection protein n=1 Tax=Azonexus hydrophilus TaxID=418702 RepID=A0ABZ2XHM4_9RHOO
MGLPGAYGWEVYTSYRSSFDQSIQPRAVKERTAEADKNAPKDTSAEAEARAEWGQLGDYFGGTLNPIFGFISVVGLFLTILYQSREMRLSTEELRNSADALKSQNEAIRRQSFEQTFFAWLGTYRQILGEITHGEKYGREALRAIWQPTLCSKDIAGWDAYFAVAPNTGNALSDALLTFQLDSLNKAGVEHYPVISKAANTAWIALYDQHENKLDSFYRVLYRLLKWIDEQPADLLQEKDKWLYVGIVRSQLSWIEMVFLFYNGMTAKGKNFKPLIERYALFDNLTIESDKLLGILKACPMDATGYAITAYSSDAARRC